MLDSRWIEENPEALTDLLAKRNTAGVDASELQARLAERRTLKGTLDGLRSQRNTGSKKIGQLMGQGKKEEAEALKKTTAEIGDDIKAAEVKLDELSAVIDEQLLGLPNVLEDDVPVGHDESDNQFIRDWGEKPAFNFEPRAHFDIGKPGEFLDFERGVKLAGSRFYSYAGVGARLERALINMMLDLHTDEFGYEERWVPSLVNDECMLTTGQFPKFKGDFYRLDADGLNLIPTSEVPLVNLYRDEIIAEEDLPLKLTAATSCFRREAGAAGKDTRGLIRVHQFQKVELVQIVHPDESRKAQEEILSHAEAVLQKLGLHYRVMLLCSGDTGGAAARTYDLEVWMPGQNTYREISSVSNVLDFQSRRGRIRYRPAGAKQKPVLAHTLNGSGVAAGRAMAAIMENYQDADGNFLIPPALEPYMARR